NRDHLADVYWFRTSIVENFVLFVGDESGVWLKSNCLLELLKLSLKIHQALVANLVRGVPRIDQCWNLLLPKPFKDLDFNVLSLFNVFPFLQQDVVCMSTI